MPVTQVPSKYLSDTINTMRRQLDELTRAVGRPAGAMRDGSDNVVEMVTGAAYPVLGARGQDVSLIMANGAATVADQTGRDPRPITAAVFNGPVQGDTTGVHHGDVGISGTEFHNHYGDLHGNSYGFHYGAVGDGTTQYQINALNVYSTGHYGTQHGDVGTPTEFWQLYGTVHAPSERRMKTDVRHFPDAGMIVDTVPSHTWRWRPEENIDEHQHAGPMADDLAEAAPWLVRHHDGSARTYADRDLIGVLWAALREARADIRLLTTRIRELEEHQ